MADNQFGPRHLMVAAARKDTVRKETILELMYFMMHATLATRNNKQTTREGVSEDTKCDVHWP